MVGICLDCLDLLGMCGEGKVLAVWANHKYHGHHTLPPDMALELNKEHKKKDNRQEKM